MSAEVVRIIGIEEAGEASVIFRRSDVYVANGNDDDEATKSIEINHPEGSGDGLIDIPALVDFATEGFSSEVAAIAIIYVVPGKVKNYDLVVKSKRAPFMQGVYLATESLEKAPETVESMVIVLDSRALGCLRKVAKLLLVAEGNGDE